LPYATVDALQRHAQAARIRGAIADTVYLLEHQPVVTLGRGARDASHLRTRSDVLSARGIDVIAVDRGGDITYHAPGQLVGYPILDLGDHGRDLHLYLRNIELTLIDLLREYGICANTISGLTGVWVQGKKIAAIGVKVTRWVTMHGFALNIDLDLSPMRNDIIPCGIADRDVTSMAELGVAATRSDVEVQLVRAFKRRFNAAGELEAMTLDDELRTLSGAIGDA
jgi:lipoate-protein ligase B